MKINSIQKSILIITSSGMLILALVLIGIQAMNEVNSSRADTNRLVTEQISLIVNHLDTFRMIQQVEFITKTVFDLEEVESVALFDKECEVINRQPLNFQTSWKCKANELEKNTVAYEVKNSWADSVGAPRFIYVKLKDSYSIFNASSILDLVVVLIAIGATLYFLVFLIREKIINPLHSLRSTICSQGELAWDSNYKDELPTELQPIYDSVYRRDQVLKSAKQELLKQKEASAMADLSQQVAHDIRSPLMILRDRLLKTDWKNDPSRTVYANALSDLENLSNQLLQNTGNFVGIHDIDEMIENVIEMKNIEFSKSITLAFEKAAQGLKVRANKVKLRAVLSNVINNARDATLGLSSGIVKINLTKDDRFVLISIVDNGIGIDNSLSKKLFSKGTSFNKPGGSGLGLYNAKNDLRDMGGNISISSTPKEGTQVLIKIPLSISDYQSCGAAPYDYAFIEDYKLSQLIWLTEAKKRNLNFVVFSEPSQFDLNMNLVKKNANIYVDSRFTTTKTRGEMWARTAFEHGYKNIFICSSDEIDISDKPWILGASVKDIPFSIIGDAQVALN